MFCRTLTRFSTSIPTPSTSLLPTIVHSPSNILAICLKSSTSVQFRLFSQQAPQRQKSIDFKASVFREPIYQKHFDLPERKCTMQICYAPSEGYSIFISCYGFVFLNLKQARILLDKMEDAVKLPNGQALVRDSKLGLYIRKNEEGLVLINAKKKNLGGLSIYPENIPELKKILVEVLEEYNKLKVEGKLGIEHYVPESC